MVAVRVGAQDIAPLNVLKSLANRWVLCMIVVVAI